MALPNDVYSSFNNNKVFRKEMLHDTLEGPVHGQKDC